MRKDRLKHCKSINEVHLSTRSYLVQSKGWKKSIAELNQNKILRNVERAGFLATYVEQKSGPFGLKAPSCAGGIGQGCGCGMSVLVPAPSPFYSFPFV